MKPKQFILNLNQEQDSNLIAIAGLYTNLVKHIISWVQISNSIPTIKQLNVPLQSRDKRRALADVWLLKNNKENLNLNIPYYRMNREGYKITKSGNLYFTPFLNEKRTPFSIDLHEKLPDHERGVITIFKNKDTWLGTINQPKPKSPR